MKETGEAMSKRVIAGESERDYSLLIINFPTALVEYW